MLSNAEAELAEIQRAKHFSLWRQERAPALNSSLLSVPPFNDLPMLWIYTGDGGGMLVTPRVGEWAIDLLVAGSSPEEIISTYDEQRVRNLGSYSELTPILGVQLDQAVDLGRGATLEPEPQDTFAALYHRIPFQTWPIPVGTSVLRQTFSVTPAFSAELQSEPAKQPSSTEPDSDERRSVRRRLHLACLLASPSRVEMPVSVLEPAPGFLFSGGAGSRSGSGSSDFPISPTPVSAQDVQRSFDALGKFDDADSLERAIERLGRSRLAANEVDRALDLGMSAEIVLMHDHGTSNTEIAHKISGRAAWLLGANPAERAEIFSAMKKLYEARSQAVHSGKLSAKSKIDLMSSDHLVGRVLNAILARGKFPDWAILTLGGCEVLGSDPGEG